MKQLLFLFLAGTAICSERHGIPIKDNRPLETLAKSPYGASVIPLGQNPAEQLAAFKQQEPYQLICDIIETLKQKHAQQDSPPQFTINSPEVGECLKRLAQKKEALIKSKSDYDPDAFTQEERLKIEEDIQCDETDLEIIKHAQDLVQG